jgi:hypothetical protein
LLFSYLAMGATSSSAASAPSILGPDPAALQAYAPVRDPFCATPVVVQQPPLRSALRDSSASADDGGAPEKARPGLTVDRTQRTTRVKVGFAGATPKKQLILPALDTHSACSTFVDFTPPRARVPGPHEWDYERVHALLGTGEIAGHMKTFTGYAELLFVACAQSAAAGGPEPRRNREPPVKILVAVATTGWCWLLRGGLHVAPPAAAAGGCCASRPPRAPTRYSRSASSWCEQRATFSLLLSDAPLLQKKPADFATIF